MEEFPVLASSYALIAMDHASRGDADRPVDAESDGRGDGVPAQFSDRAQRSPRERAIRCRYRVNR